MGGFSRILPTFLAFVNGLSVSASSSHAGPNYESMLAHAPGVLKAAEAASVTSFSAFSVCNAGSGLANTEPGGPAAIEAIDQATVRRASGPAEEYQT